MPTLFTINPYAALTFFIPVTVFSMVFMHPVYVCINVLASFACCMAIARKETLASIRFTLTFAAVIALINPVFNTMGDTILFTYFGRRYTLQALVYGCVMAGILVSCINWFSCMGKVITKDKFIYITAGRMPHLSALIAMVISLVPFFQAKLAEISRVQSMLKKESGTKQALKTLDCTVSYAFEHAVNLSVSMKNRAFGTGKKTQYARYCILASDIVFIIIILLMTWITVVCCFTPATTVQIIPALVTEKITGKEMAGIICYIILVTIPVTTAIAEEIQWQYLKSKI